MTTTDQHVMTHAEGVEAIKRFRQASARLLLAEPKCPGVIEQPDGFEIDCRGTSWLWEFKTSVSDLLADRNKPFRRGETMGMGQYRIYVAQEGVIETGRIDEDWRWGFWEILASAQIVERLAAPQWHSRYVNTWAQNLLLAQAVRNAAMKGNADPNDNRKASKVSQSWHPTIRGAIVEHGAMPCRQMGDIVVVAHGLKSKPTAVGNWIREDARAGRIPGVTTERQPGGKTYLILKDAEL